MADEAMNIVKSTNNRVWVIGKHSYIAQKVISALRDEHTRFSCLSRTPAADDLYFDLTRAGDFDFSMIEKDDIVLMFAGMSSPDECGRNRTLAEKINVVGTSIFAQNVLERKGRVIFFSSDTVYGPSGEVCYEDSLVDPVNFYAQLKCDVEQRFRNEKNFKVLRLSYVFGRGDKYMRYLASCSARKTAAQVYHPFLRNVVSLSDVVLSILAVIARWESFESRVLNVCGPELLSRIDLARLFKMKFDPDLQIEAVYPAKEFFLERPQIIRTGSRYLYELLGRSTLAIKDAWDTEMGSTRKTEAAI